MTHSKFSMNTSYTNDMLSPPNDTSVLGQSEPCQYQSVPRDLDKLLSQSAPMAKQGLKVSDKNWSPNNHSVHPLSVPSMVAAGAATIFNQGLEDGT